MRLSRTTLDLVLAGILVGCGLPATGRAAEGLAESTCPTREAVTAAVRSLLGPSSLGDGAAGPVILVRDRGNRYLVSAKGNTREYDDPARDCEERARVAAVFVALILSPSSNERTPKPGADAPPDRAVVASRPAPGPSPAPSPSLSSRAARGWWGMQLEAGALGAATPRAGNSQLTAGGELRLIVTADGWGLSLGGGVPAASTFHSGLVRVGETRYPADLSIRRLWTTGWVATALDLGALGAFCELQQADRPDARTTSHVELGLRAAATLAVEGARFGLYIRAFSEFIPITRQIAVEPQGTVGRTSPFWVGAALGVTARFH